MSKTEIVCDEVPRKDIEDINHTTMVVVEHKRVTTKEKWNMNKSNIKYSRTQRKIFEDLESAISSGNKDAVEHILKSRMISVNHADREGYTPLIKAACTGNADIVRLILCNADLHVNQQDINGYSALMWAADLGQASVVKMILQHPDIKVNIIYILSTDIFK